jgi:AraC-like DNA-binding protein
MELQTHGAKKYPTSALLRSSAGLGWSTISAEQRSHGVSETPVIVPQNVELCLAVAGNEKRLVRRTGGGQCQETIPRTGSIWLSPNTAAASHQLDHVRLRRVLDYISAHVADEVTLAALARVACLSTFHFARMFTLAVGVPPHRYVSRMRLENAMAEIAAGRLPLAQIASNASFSSQASFTRAFRRATGMTPAEYRRSRCTTSAHILSATPAPRVQIDRNTAAI